MEPSFNQNDSRAFLNPQVALLDSFFPGFSVLSSLIYKYLKIDISLYVPAFLTIGVIAVAFPYTSEYLWGQFEYYLMSSADVRVDDEMYNMLMAWVAAQKFAKASRRFVANTNLNSRNWYLWRSEDEDTKDEDSDLEVDEDNSDLSSGSGRKHKTLQYTPSFGNHYFWYKNRLLLFRRTQGQERGYMPVSEREEISVLCFGRNPSILKELLDECRLFFLKNDEKKTVIYRGTIKAGTTEPTWTRCMSRVSRPLSTVVLDEELKAAFLEDIQRYLSPLTRRFYNNRGLPWRRGYLMTGPAGTGKSSLSFAIAGHFKLKIYIVSLNSLAMTEENLGTLFADLPTRCVVLLEDIDTAGLTHTRETPEQTPVPGADSVPLPTASEPKLAASGNNNTGPVKGGISLSALLNIIDGVASQEGRILIMTTNHVEKLDKALIRPGRVDMTINFELATPPVCATIFKGIFTTLKEDFPPSYTDNNAERKSQDGAPHRRGKANKMNLEQDKREIPTPANDRSWPVTEYDKEAEDRRIAALADKFATIIPSREFSPAEIQGFLLKYQGEPERAVASADDWVCKMRAEKENSQGQRSRG